MYTPKPYTHLVCDNAAPHNHLIPLVAIRLKLRLGIGKHLLGVPGKHAPQIGIYF